LASGYGRIWLVKMALVATLMGLAILNRQVLTPRLARRAPHAAAGLRRSIATELVLLVAIVGATALLGQTPPPRAMERDGHAAHAQHEAQHGHGLGAYAATV